MCNVAVGNRGPIELIRRIAYFKLNQNLPTAPGTCRSQSETAEGHVAFARHDVGENVSVQRRFDGRKLNVG